MTQVLNFASFKVQKSANERTSQVGVTRGQAFKLKFRKFNSKNGGVTKIETIYTISDEKFAELGLEAYGIVQLEGTAYIAVVNNDDATMLKRTEKLKEGAPKGKKFKSTILDKSLLDAGVIEDREGLTQFLDLVKVADTTTLGEGDSAIQAVAIYEIVKGVDARSEAEKAEDNAADTQEDETSTDAGSDEVGETNAPADETESNDDF